jgi:hypothetical protein
MLRFGWNLANAARSVVDQGLVCAELAELEEVLGDRAKAILEYERAVGFFTEVATEEWLNACQKRLIRKSANQLN